MRVLVTGVAGQLGHDVVFALQARGHHPIGSDICLPSSLPPSTEPLGLEPPDPLFLQMDITNREDVIGCVKSLKPDAIIHCAAWTAVDAAEEDEN